MGTLADERIVAAGGSANGKPPVSLSDVEVYTPSTNSWKRFTHLPEPRSALAGAVIGGDVFLAIGGFVAPHDQAVLSSSRPSYRCGKDHTAIVVPVLASLLSLGPTTKGEAHEGKGAFFGACRRRLYGIVDCGCGVGGRRAYEGHDQGSGPRLWLDL